MAEAENVEPDEIVEGDLVDEPDEIVAGQELAVVEERHAAPREVAVLPSPGEWEATMVMARTIAATTFVPKAYRGNPEAVVAGILYGREIGLGPMVALQKVHIIDGKPSLAAEEMLAQMRRGGLVILESESTRDRAWIHARRSDTGEEAEVEWTIADAVEAGLTGKDNWAKYCQDMLWARCVGRLCRRLGSDMVGGMVYAAEEMRDWDDGGYGGAGYDTPAREVPVSEITSWRAERFDPALSMDANAPKNWEEIQAAIMDLDVFLADWVATAVLALYGQRAADLTGPKRIEVGRRIANAIVRVRDELFADGDFPPPSDDEYRRVFAWAFSGVDATPPGPFDGEPSESAEDTPEEGDGAGTTPAESGTDDESGPEEQESLLDPENGSEHRDPTAEDPK